MRLLMLCVVSLLLYEESSTSGHSETVQVAEDVTVTLCPDLHLCQNMGCGTSWIRNSACQCDWACEFFDDCCLDFASVCSIESSNVLDPLTKPQFECISPPVQGIEFLSVARGFWMVSHCPYAAEVSQTYKQIRENCESTSDTNPMTLIPVTDASNITFRNIYCALCHGRPTSELVAWRLNATCRNPIPQNTSYAEYLRSIWNECNHFMILPAVEVSGPATRRPCLPSLISTCQQSNRPSLIYSCQSFTAVVKSSDDGSLYRNPACFAACNGLLTYAVECPTETSEMVHDQTFPEIMQTTTTPDPTTISYYTHMPVTQTETTHLLPDSLFTIHRDSQQHQAQSYQQLDISASVVEAAISQPVLSDSYYTHMPVTRHIIEKMQALAATTRPTSTTNSYYTRMPVTRHPTSESARPPAPPMNPLSFIFNFNPTHESEECQQGDLFDPFSQTCLSPQCEEGLEYLASEQRCEPQPEPANDNTFRCLGDSNHGTGILLMVWTSLESTNLTSNSSNIETRYTNKERCIRDLLDVNLTSVPEAVYPYSGNSSKFAFNILVDVILDDDEKVKRNDTGFENIILRKETIDSIVAEIENKLEESAKTDASQCGIQSLQIVQYCSETQSNPKLRTLCSQVEWLSLENETEIRVNNQTVWAFDSSHDAWYRLQDYKLGIQYNKNGSLFKKLKLEIGPCSEAPNNSCPAFIELNESQFSLVDEDTEDFEKHANGSLIFLQTEEVLEPGEFIRTDDGQISICVNKLPQNGTQFFNFNNAQAILSTVGLVISVAAGTVSLVTYLVFPSLHVRTRKAIMGMVTSLVAAQTFLLLILSGIAANNDKTCMAVAVAEHFLWLASLTWTNVLAFLLWNIFATKNPSPTRSNLAVTSKVNILSFSYALGIPLAIVTVCLIIHFCSCTNIVAMYENNAPCWIKSGTINLVVFGAPMALFLLINILLFVQTVWAIRSSHRRAAAKFNQGRDTSFLKRRSKELFIYVKMASLMGFTWVFGFSAAFSGVTSLWYLFIILNSLQGFFIFLSFTFSGQVKKLWMKKLMSIRGSVLNKMSIETSTKQSTAMASSISAVISASDATSSNDYTSTSNDRCYEASLESTSRFKMALRRLKEKTTQRSELTADNSSTKPSIPVKEDVPVSIPFPSDCHASSEYEEVIPGRCLQKGDDKKRFWHKLSIPRPKHTTPSFKTAERMTKIQTCATGSLAGPTVCLAGSAYEEVIPGRCLKAKADNTQDSPTSSKSAEDETKSNTSEFHPHGEDTEKQVPKIPLLPFKIPGKSKPSVPQKNVDEYDNNEAEKLPSRRLMNSLEKEPETEPICKVWLDKPAILPRMNLKSKAEDAQTEETSYNPSNHQLNNKKREDSNRKVSLTKPLPPTRPKPRLPGVQEAAEGDHPKQEVTLNASHLKVSVRPFLSSYLKKGDSVITPTGNPNRVDTSDDKTDTNMDLTQKTLPSAKQPLPPRPRVKPPNALESHDESGWHDVIGQIKGQSLLKSN